MKKVKIKDSGYADREYIISNPDTSLFDKAKKEIVDKEKNENLPN